MLAEPDLVNVDCLGYDSQPICSSSSKKFYDLVSHISGKVGDIGCGTGVQWYHRFKGKWFDNAEIHCLDVFPSDRIGLYKEFIEGLSNNKLYSELRYRKKLPYSDDFFDTTLHFETLPYINYPVETEVAEVARVTKPNGRVFLTAPCKDLKGCESRSFDRKELRNLLTNAGLASTIRVYTAGELGIPGVPADTKATLFASCLKSKS